jgi:hypothetical protein
MPKAESDNYRLWYSSGTYKGEDYSLTWVDNQRYGKVVVVVVADFLMSWELGMRAANALGR